MIVSITPISSHSRYQAAGKTHSVTDQSPAELISEFVRGEYPKVVAAVSVATNDSNEAEDAVQEALIKVLSGKQQPDRLAAWVTVVAINQVRTRQRRGAAEQRAVERIPRHIAHDEAANVSDEVTLRNVIAVLPYRQREIVLMHYYLDASVDQIAKALDISKGTVKTQLHRGRAAIARALGEEEESS